MSSAIGQTIKSRREACGLSLGELAQRAEVSRGYLSQIETGQCGNPSAQVVYRIGRVLGATVEQILCGNFTPAEPMRRRSVVVTDREFESVLAHLETLRQTK